MELWNTPLHTLHWFLNLLYIFKLFGCVIIINIIQFGTCQLNVYTVLDIHQQKSISPMILIDKIIILF